MQVLMRGALLGTVLLTTALTTTPISPSTASATTAQDLSTWQSMTTDEVYADIARRIPGFAGLVVDDTSMTVKVLATNASPEVAKAVVHLTQQSDRFPDLGS